MKKILAILTSIVILSASTALAKNEVYAITNPIITQQYTKSQIVCIDGYKWLITVSHIGNGDKSTPYRQSGFGVSTVQMLKEGPYHNSPPQPIKCKE